MKATQKDFPAAAAAIARTLAIAFFCGPDEAGASAAAARLAAMLPEPGERVELSGAELRADPVRLGDEVRSNSLFGGARHLLVRANGDEAHDAVQILCELIDSGEARGASPVLITATAATDKARTARLLAPRADALVAMFYPPDLRTIAAEVQRMSGAAGIKLGEDLAERIARAAGLDVRLAQSEVTKLALYLDATPMAPKQADAEALDAIGARTEEDGVAPLVNAVLSAETGRLAAELRRLHDVSLNPVTVVLALERRAVQLVQLSARLGRGGRIAELLEAEQRARRIPWRDRRDLEVQLRRWNAAALERLVERLAALHRTLLTNSQSAELMLVQELTMIARFAGQRR